MNPRVKTAEPIPDYKLLLTFNNDEHKIFDLKPYLSRGIFTSLKDIRLFNCVKVFNGSILWPGDLDLCPDTLYEDSLAAE